MSLIELICILGRPTKYATQENDELRLPLQNGWKREINVREYSKSGIRGDVVYFAPCGKKFKSWAGKFAGGVKVKHCEALSTNF